MKVRIFTDGACSGNPGPGGWATVFSLDKKYIKFSGNETNTTNNRMELMAVVKAYERIVEKFKKENNVEYELCADSAYVVNSINNGWLMSWNNNGWKTSKGDLIKNQDLWKRLVKLIDEVNEKKIPLKVIKIKGHHGIAYNELVDRIARQEVCQAKINMANKGGQNDE